MKVDGKQIAQKLYEDLTKRVGDLKKRGITPHLTVILAGDDQASIAYVNQKRKWGEYIGAQITILKYPDTVTQQELITKIKELNQDPANHATLIQRPLPPQINPQELELLLDPQKDIDGFHPDSPYTLPLPLAVVKILEEIFKIKEERDRPPEKSDLWLKDQSIVVIGKGPTGGQPIIEYLNKLEIHPTLIDSKTPNANDLIKNADIIIAAVGKPGIITPEKIKKDAILIGVGIYRGEDNKLHGDYNETEIDHIASYYTPTPGGVGPVNVAMLMDNLLTAAEKQTI